MLKTSKLRKQLNSCILNFLLHPFLVLVIAFFSLMGCKDDQITRVYTIEEEVVVKPDTVSSDATDRIDPSTIDASKIYIPKEHSAIDFYKKSSVWSYARSKQSEHFIVFWAKEYGDKNPNSNEVPEFYRVNIDDLLAKAEKFYDMNVNTLKFAETGLGKSNLDKYKMEIYLHYTTEWMAYGAGYDDVIGALWINPATVHPVGSVIAHEIGHSFQYQVLCDLGAGHGFRYGFGGNGGNGFWEQCAQWQAYQSYPEEVFAGYHFPVYCDNYNKHLIHEDYRYASYFIHYYWAEKHGIDLVGRLWREAKEPEDPLQAYMRITGITAEKFNDEIYDAATRFVTWDIDALRVRGKDYIGKQTYSSTKLSDGSHLVSYDRCPGTTGYNVIPLNVPKSGTEISADFTGMVNEKGFNMIGLPGRAGWRYGYVALKKDGSRVYSEMFKSSYQSYSKADFIVPENVSKLWFVVTGAPNTYSPHAWDDKPANDDQWPYKVKFTNTDLFGSVIFTGSETPSDTILTYNVEFPVSATEYVGPTIELGGDFNKVATAFVMQISDITAKLGGSIKWYAVESNGRLNATTTANGYGHWFNASGNVCTWGSDARVFSEFNEKNWSFSIGQYPGQCSAGDKYTIKQALVYEYETGKTVQATFVFNITLK